MHPVAAGETRVHELEVSELGHRHLRRPQHGLGKKRLGLPRPPAARATWWSRDIPCLRGPVAKDPALTAAGVRAECSMSVVYSSRTCPRSYAPRQVLAGRGAEPAGHRRFGTRSGDHSDTSPSDTPCCPCGARAPSCGSLQTHTATWPLVADPGQRDALTSGVGSPRRPPYGSGR